MTLTIPDWALGLNLRREGRTWRVSMADKYGAADVRWVGLGATPQEALADANRKRVSVLERGPRLVVVPGSADSGVHRIVTA